MKLINVISKVYKLTEDGKETLRISVESDSTIEIKQRIEKAGKDLNTVVRSIDKSGGNSSLYLVEVVCSDADILESLLADISSENKPLSKEAQELKEISQLRGYEEIIQKYLLARRCKKVQPKEVADKLWSTLPKECKEKYKLGSLEAAAEYIDTEELDNALTDCLQKYQKSVIIDKKINEYLDKVAPNREAGDESALDDVIKKLPHYIRLNDDRKYLAYTAICYIEDEASKELPKLDPNILTEDEDIHNDVIADMTINEKRGEPYEIVYRSGIEKAIASVAKKTGKMYATPTRYADIMRKSLRVGIKDTLGEDLFQEVQRSKKLQKVIQEKEGEIRKSEYQRNNRDTYQDLGALGYRDKRKEKEEYFDSIRYENSRTSHSGLISFKTKAIMIDVVSYLIELIVAVKVDSGILLLTFGAALVAVGWGIKPNLQNLENADTKHIVLWIILIVIGYSFKLVWFVNL